MERSLSAWLFVITLMTHYGYYALPGDAYKVYHALQGLWALSILATIIYAIQWHFTDTAARILLLLAVIIGAVENTMTFICGGWYAWIYSGPPLTGDTCTAVFGWQVSKPLIFTLATIAAIYPRSRDVKRRALDAD